MDIAIATTPDALTAAAGVLLHSLNRGDFDADPDFDHAAGVASGRFAQAALDANHAHLPEASATVDDEHLDEILAILESDPQAATTPLARFITDANAALDAR